MKPGQPMSTLLQSLQTKVEIQSQATEEQMQQMLNDFEKRLSEALNAALRRIEHDMRDLEKLSGSINNRTVHQIEAQASSVREATTALEDSRKEWRTVTWKTMLPTYLAGVFLTFWVLLMAVQLTFPEQPSTLETPGLATFGLEGTRVTRGLGGLGQVINLPRGVTLTNCPVPNLGGGEVCVETSRTR